MVSPRRDEQVLTMAVARPRKATMANEKRILIVGNIQVLGKLAEEVVQKSDIQAG